MHAVLITLALMVTVLGDFKPYLAARSEPWLEKYQKEAQASVKESTGAEFRMWITDDSFDVVRKFYASLGDERPAFAETLAEMLSKRTGKVVRATYVVFDGAGDPVSSRYYVAIQRPATISFEPVDVRDVTLISLYRKK